MAQSNLLNCAKNRTPDHVLSNNDLCLQAAMQYVLLFLVLALNSDQFQILWSYNTFTQAVCSYVLLVGKSCPIHTRKAWEQGFVVATRQTL